MTGSQRFGLLLFLGAIFTLVAAGGASNLTLWQATRVVLGAVLGAALLLWPIRWPDADETEDVEP